MENVEQVENVKLDKIGIGEDVPQVEAKDVKVEMYNIELVNNKEGKKVGDKLVLNVIHPDVSGKMVDISRIKYQRDDKLKFSGLWVHVDKDGKLPFRSALAELLRKTGCNTISEIQGKTLPTVLDDNGYLAIKGY